MHCVERCPECPSRGMEIGSKPVVSGDWNEGPHNLLFVGEAPGREENNRQRVFCGKTGDEFNRTYLPLAGLTRDQVSMTNSVKCHWADTSDAPPDSLVKSCSEFHLRRELAAHDPDYVVLMGGTANSLLDLDVEMEHGMMREGELLGWRGTIFSTFHPALGLHKPDAMLAMVDKLDGDFPRLGRMLRGKLRPLVDAYPDPEFSRLVSVRQVRTVMRDYAYWDAVAVDTESKKRWLGYPATVRYTPWCATWCHEPGEAFMVRVSDEDAYREFCTQLARFSTIIMHNSPHDHSIIEQSGVYLPWSKIVDTMQMAYNDGRVRKGLKILGYRLLGKRMISFDEVVIPHSRVRALDYLEKAMQLEWPKPVQERTGELVTRNCDCCKGKGSFSLGRGKAKKHYQCRDCMTTGKVTVPKYTRKQSLNDKLFRLATDMRKNAHGLKLWERWDGWVEKDPVGMRAMIDKLGPIPIPSIEYVPDDEALIYACGDAHETRRLYPVLQERLRDIRQISPYAGDDRSNT